MVEHGVCISIGGGVLWGGLLFLSSLAYNAIKGVTLAPWQGHEALLPKGMCVTIF